MQGLSSQGERTNILAAAVQAGSLDILTLWAAVRGYAFRKARRWAAALGRRSGQNVDDLMQEGFIALLRAVELWERGKGMSFIGVYELALRDGFSRACGCRTKRESEDPLRAALSLNMPVGEDEEDAGTPGSLIPDESAEASFLNIEQQELADAVQQALQGLPEHLREALTDAYWYDKPADAKLRAAALKALRHPSVSRALRTFY